MPPQFSRTQRVSKNSSIPQNLDGVEGYFTWRGMVHSYETLKKESIVYQDTQRLRYLRRQIIIHYLRNFFFFPLFFIRLLTPSYMKGQNNVWKNLRTIVTTREFRPLRIAVVSQLFFLYLLVHIGIVVFFNFATPTLAATYSWIQNSWSGGATTTATAVHPGNKTAWNKYSSASSTITAGSTVTLSPVPASTILTSDSDFSGGTFSDTDVDGTGSSAFVELTGGIEEVNEWDVILKRAPGDCDSAGRIFNNGAPDDVIYVIGGTTGTGFCKYNITSNTWTVLTPAPVVSFPSQYAIRNSSEDFIYFLRSSAAGFYRYSISNNSWTALATPANWTQIPLFRNGTDNYIYMMSSQDQNLYRYSISDNSWSSALNGGMSLYGGAAAFDGSDHVYFMSGNNSATFSRYTISTNSTTFLTSLPGAVGTTGYTSGNLLHRDGEDYLYVVRGKGTSDFYRYSISGNSWTTLTSLPGAMGNGGGWMVRSDSDNYIYVIRDSSTTFYRYSISGNSWTTLSSIPSTVGNFTSSDLRASFTSSGQILAFTGEGSGFYLYSPTSSSWVANNTESNLTSVPATIGLGAQIIRNGSDDHIYVLRGGSQTSFYRYSISGDSWTTLTAVPGTVGTGARMIRNGSDDHIYVLRGGSQTSFYRYSISGNSWTTLTAVPGTVGGASSVIRNGSEDYIYVIPGNGVNTFYRYSISGNSWTTLTAPPGTPVTGSRLFRNGSDNDIYLLRGGAEFYRYSISGDSWATLTSAPGTLGDGSSVVWDGSENYMYVLRGNNQNSFYRYSISGNSWTSLTVVPGTAYNGAQMMRSGDDEIYVLIGDDNTRLSRYSISGNSWTTLSAAPGNIGDGSGAILSESGDSFYVLQGGGTTNFYKFIIRTTTYDTPGTYTSPVVDTGGNAGYTTLSYTSSTPANTTLTIDARAGDTATPDGTWTSWTTGIASGGSISSFGSRRYIQYRANLATSDIDTSPTLNDLTVGYSEYTSGSLISSPYNAGDSTNVFGGVSWTASTSPGTSITFQIRTSPNNSSWTDWLGPDGTSNTYFTDATGAQDPPASLSDGVNDQWMQYRATLTGSGSAAPALTESTMTYVVNAPPEVELVSSTPITLSSAGVVPVTFRVKDLDTALGATPGYVAVDLQYCTSNCSSLGNEVWATAASTTVSGSYGSLAVTGADFTEYSLIWDTKTSYNNQYNGTDFKIRIRANDSEAANNYGYAESDVFVLDTKNPVVTVGIDGRSDAAYNLSVDVTDDSMSGLEMKLSNDSDLSSDGLNSDSGTWITYAATTTWDFPVGGTTIYYQVRDAYGNISSGGAIASAQTPAVPAQILYRDVSNAETNEYREFIAWGVIANPNPGFSHYTLYRSTNGETWSVLTTEADRLINYYIDPSLDSETTYYYRVTAEDDDGNISNYSAVISDKPNGQGGSDVTPPTISNVTTTVLLPQSVTIQWDTDELSDSLVDYMLEAGGDFSGAETVGLSAIADNSLGLGAHSVTLSNLTPNTTYYFRVRSTDVDNNEGESAPGPDGYSFTTPLGPVISDVGAVEVMNTSATVIWNTDQASNSYVHYALSPTFSTSTSVGVADESTSHAVLLTGLVQGTTYYYYVTSGIGEDKNVVEGEVQYYSFTTTADVDAPVITFDSESDIAATDTAIALSWITDEVATSTLEYGTSNAYGTIVANGNFNTDHIFSLTSLLPGTQYFFRIRSADENGNVSSAIEFSATTVDTRDYDAPVISNVGTSVITDTDAIVVWDTDEPATGQVLFSLTSSSTSYEHGSDVVSTYNEDHAIKISGLATSTQYYFVVVSEDPTGNTATSSEYSFTTLETLSEESEVLLREEEARAEGLAQGVAQGSTSGGSGSSKDRNPPSVTGLSIDEVTPHSVAISWKATERSVGILEFGTTTAYSKSVLNVPLAFVQDHRVVLTDLIPNTTYYFAATAVDDSFNRSSELSSSFTTAVLDGESVETLPEVPSQDTAQLSPEETEEIFSASLQRAGDIIRSMSTQVGVGALENNLFEQAALIRELSQLLPLPIISGQPQVEVGTTYATIIWSTDKESNSLVSYAPQEVFDSTGFYDQTVGNSEEMTTSHSVTLKGLQPGTVYHYQLTSRTITGSETTSRDFSFKTDDEFAEISTYRVVPASSEEANFSWITTVPTNASIAYTPYRNGNLNLGAKKILKNSTFGTTHEFDVSDFEAGVLYDIELSGVDAGGNVVTKLIQGFTTDGKDMPPIISQIQTDSAIVPGGKERIQIIISWNTNELSTSQVFYRQGFASEGVEFTDATPLDSGYVKKHVVVISNFEPGQVYQFVVESTDSGGNTTRSKTITILTPQREQSVFQVIMSNVEDMFSWVGKIRQ